MEFGDCLTTGSSNSLIMSGQSARERCLWIRVALLKRKLVGIINFVASTAKNYYDSTGQLTQITLLTSQIGLGEVGKKLMWLFLFNLVAERGKTKSGGEIRFFKIFRLFSCRAIRFNIRNFSGVDTKRSISKPPS